MSDLLSRLIDRATGAPSRVEPVQPSRYESAHPPDVPSFIEQTATRETEQVDGREASPQQRGEPAAPGVSVQYARLERNAGQPAQHRGLPPVAEPPSVSSAHATSVSTRTGGIQPPARDPATIVIEPERRASEPASSIEKRARSLENKDGLPASLTSASPLAAMVTVARKDSPPQFIPHATAPNIAHSEGAAPVEVQVTIGRVEVRTNPAAVPIPQRRISRPTMSLEDYLRRRNGGAR